MWPTEGPADADRNETLISSDRVIGSAVYGMDGSKIGTLESVMLKRHSGRIAYAVLGLGGFLGIGTDHYPIPWNMLHYDERLGGYATDLTRRDVEHAPRFSEREAWNWDSDDTARQIDGYYRERSGAKSARADNSYAAAAEI
jgi:sporulation protein YlmC with PRC-barrel domain